jgi:hypothetical protein
MRVFTIVCLFLALIAAGCGKKAPAQVEAASLDDLNRALSVVAMQSRSFPPSTNELAAFLKLSGKSMPVPQPGKKLVLDPGKRLFVLENQ